MKKGIILPLVILISIIGCGMLWNDSRDTIIKGYVFDDAKYPMIGASVILKGTTIGTITDLDGYFELKAPEAKNTLIVSYTGFISFEFEACNEEINYVTLTETKNNGEVVICGTSKLKKEKESISGVLHGKVSGHKLTEAENSNIIIRGYSGNIKPKNDFDYSESPASEAEFSARVEDVGKSELRSGVLTAGEWNDLNKWEDWKSLLKNEDFTEMESYWGFDMGGRISVFVTNKFEFPVVDCLVSLKNKSGKILWQSKTDNAGKAELWNGIFKEKSNYENLEIEVLFRNKNHIITEVKKFEEGINYIQIQENCTSLEHADIMFVVDATGSMADEIDYLKSELSDVVNRAKAVDRKLNFRLGSVFFRDKGDEYLTRQSNLSGNPEDCYEFINENMAGGGGDYPEAVHTGLQKALDQDWNESAVARIIFLLLDAPPHHDSTVLQKLKLQIQEASRKGIKIIPITASGINRQTEFLMKFFSISTNGTYVFLTDDSGIGNKHLSPLVNDFEVEKLNDLLVRLISNYTKAKSCEENQKPIEMAKIKMYPNPTSNYVHIDLEEDVDQVLVRSASGMVVQSLKSVPQGITRIHLESLVDGVYTIQFYDEGHSLSRQLILIN